MTYEPYEYMRRERLLETMEEYLGDDKTKAKTFLLDLDYAVTHLKLYHQQRCDELDRILDILDPER